ncbi:hypothetical protein HanIR_Chr05g0238611 [Helianthus annuus]|nr:hypothetical protein HanIR_Chr05g0238611 [Helianthus annuus]
METCIVIMKLLQFFASLVLKVFDMVINFMVALNGLYLIASSSCGNKISTNFSKLIQTVFQVQ